MNAPAALQCYLFDFLSEFHRTYPKINFKIHTDSSNDSITRLRSGETDLVFATTPVASVHTLNATYIQWLNDIIVGGKSFAFLAENEVSLSELQSYPFISLAQGMQYRQFCDQFFARNHIDFQPAMEADSSDLTIPMAIHDWGLALVSEKIAADPIRAGELYQVRLCEKIPPRHAVMIVDPQKQLSRAAQLIRDTSVGQLKTGQ